MRIGIVGVGVMGRLAAVELAKCGHEVTLFDSSLSARGDDDASLGLRWATSLMDCARERDVVLIYVRTGEQVEQVLLSEQRGLASMNNGASSIVVCSTVSPTTIAMVAEACLEAGIRLVDAPVNGRAPNSRFFVGASRADVEYVAPVLRCIGRSVHHVGPPGSGTRTKLLHQVLLYANHLHAIAALEVGDKLGLPLESLLPALLGSSADSEALRELALRRREETRPSGSIDGIGKDLKLASDLIEGVDFHWPGARDLFDAYTAAHSVGLGSKDFDSIRQIL